VTMDREDAATIAKFESGLAEVNEVRHAERLFGDPDYLVRIATTDIAAYQTLRDEKLATLPGVQRLTSTIVMKRIVNDRPFPIASSSSRATRRKRAPDADSR
jgi:DNA-binding Lrp family transcriptional regulator